MYRCGESLPTCKILKCRDEVLPSSRPLLFLFFPFLNGKCPIDSIAFHPWQSLACDAAVNAPEYHERSHYDKRNAADKDKTVIEKDYNFQHEISHDEFVLLAKLQFFTLNT